MRKGRQAVDFADRSEAVSDDAKTNAVPLPDQPEKVDVQFKRELEIDFDPEAVGADLSQISADDLDNMTLDQLEQIRDAALLADKNRARHDQEQDRLRESLIEAIRRKRQRIREEWEEEKRQRDEEVAGKERELEEREQSLIEANYGSNTNANLVVKSPWRRGAGDNFGKMGFLVVLLLVGAVFGGTRINMSTTTSAEAEATATAVVIQAGRDLARATVEDGVYSILDAEGQAAADTINGRRPTMEEIEAMRWESVDGE